MRLTGGSPRADVGRATNRAELIAATQGLARPAEPSVRSFVPPAVEAAALAALADATDFARFDVAIVRAGGARARLSAAIARGDTVAVYFAGACAPCGGGDPGSYEQARRAYERETAAGAELLQIPKGARVVVERCGATSCGACRHDLP